jgi:hypothetical protein
MTTVYDGGEMRTPKGGPRTRLRILTVNDSPAIAPVLVCSACHAHHPALGHEASLTQWVCAADGTRRAWGAL